MQGLIARVLIAYLQRKNKKVGGTVFTVPPVRFIAIQLH